MPERPLPPIPGQAGILESLVARGAGPARLLRGGGPLGLALFTALIGVGCSKSWASAIEDNKATMAPLREKLLKAKAEIDKTPASGLPQCTPNAAYTSAHKGGNTDFFAYERINKSWEREVRQNGDVRTEIPHSTPLSRTLTWSNHTAYSSFSERSARNPDGFRDVKPSKSDLADFELVKGIRNFVIVRELPGSIVSHVKVEAFFVSTQPLKVVCTYAMDGPQGGTVGTAPTAMVERKYNKEGKKTEERRFETGGYQREDTSYKALQLFKTLTKEKLGIVVDD